MDGLVGQLSVNPADEAGELGVPGKCLLLIPEGLLFEVIILTEIASPLNVGVEDPALWPCDAAWGDLTDPEVIEVGISEPDGYSQSLVSRIGLGLRV